jgi:Tfp pilus assembly protein PilO
MGNSALGSLLAGKQRRWVGIGWGLLLAGVLVLPGVDRGVTQYRILGEVRAKLTEKAKLPERARLLAERAAQMEEDMVGLEAALVPTEALPTLQQEITRMSRDLKCRLRSIRPGSRTKRALEETLGTAGARGDRRLKAADWHVDEQTLSVSIEGSYRDAIRFLTSLDNNARLLQYESIQLYRQPDTESEVVLDLTLKTFNLQHGDAG